MDTPTAHDTPPIFGWITKHCTSARFLKGIVLLYVTVCLILGIALAELSLHLHKLPLSGIAAHRDRIRRQFHVEIQDAALTASDGADLKAWFIQPLNPNNKSVLILHGIAGNRIDSVGFAEIFLNQGYTVLLPDSREHGESGGRIATYGILEKRDVNLWTHWLRQRAPGCTYLLGESMGAAVGLQSTPVTPDLCAVAVEAPYSTFRAISYERLAQGTGTNTLSWRTIGRPILEAAIAYTWLRYGIYLPDADPQSAVQHSSTPTFLIAGTADSNIPMHHAQQLESACTHCALWIVPGAEHCGASSVAHAEFEQRILDWFQSHDQPQAQLQTP